jgi:hypothetical protein
LQTPALIFFFVLTGTTILALPHPPSDLLLGIPELMHCSSNACSDGVGSVEPNESTLRELRESLRDRTVTTSSETELVLFGNFDDVESSCLSLRSPQLPSDPTMTCAVTSAVTLSTDLLSGETHDRGTGSDEYVMEMGTSLDWLGPMLCGPDVGSTPFITTKGKNM